MSSPSPWLGIDVFALHMRSLGLRLARSSYLSIRRWRSGLKSCVELQSPFSVSDIFESLLETRRWQLLRHRLHHKSVQLIYQRQIPCLSYGNLVRTGLSGFCLHYLIYKTMLAPLPFLLCSQGWVWKLILSKGILRILSVNWVHTVQTHINSKVFQIGTWCVCSVSGVGKAHLAVLLKRKPPLDVLHNLSIPQRKSNLVLQKFSICLLIWRLVKFTFMLLCIKALLVLYIPPGHGKRPGKLVAC